MLWFEGAIPDAIASAKQRSSVFVVFVAGDDEQSTQMAASWENEKVAEAVAEGFVAIKIDTKSEACLQFSQIYPVVCIPSSFFIGDSGIPLEVIAGSVSAEELTARIHKVTQMRTLKSDVATQNQNQSASLPSAPHLSPNSASTSEISQPIAEHHEIHPSCEMGTPADEVHPGQTSPSQEADSVSLDGTVTESQPAELLEDKVDRITKKLEDRREQQKRDEEQKEIKKEIERRKTGKDMLEFKRRQEEDLTKRMLEERSREKAEEKAARERIRQQIALDRAERAARFAKSQEEAEALKAAALQAQQAEMEARKEAAQKERSAIARIQFRLPDGSSFTNQFPSESPLEEARQFAAKTVGNTYGNFTLATMFPRREFTKDDYRKTLLTLELAPSASVVLLPAGRPPRTVMQSSDAGILALLGTIFYPFLAVWRILSNFLFASPYPTQNMTRATNQQENPHPSASSPSEPKRETVRKRMPEKRGEEFKKEGKIYRLRTQDDEDENNTWNGNSTQQM
ncbi:UBX domain-containing protein 4 [Rhinatrema bivittatum]|uniref:UBX domain-containing protein 4 n=1 Tax=Rhinatrema bivittatum TaxID=194408 RepID=UPI0011262BBB|nr:UBX domain-containing protein 4 [Rhinatrema bivittatum]